MCAASGSRSRASTHPRRWSARPSTSATCNSPGLLHARLLRSPHAHARIKRIDTSKAQGAARRARRADRRRHPELKPGAKTRAHAILAIDRVVFAGQPVAAVAADDLAIADEALDLIEVEYEVLPVAVDPLKSMQPDAPRVADVGTEADTSEALAHSGIARHGHPDHDQRAEHRPAGALERAATSPPRWPRPTSSSRTPTACRWSTRATSSRTRAIADYDPHGRITIWSSTQGSFDTAAPRSPTSSHIPEARIKVIPMECGGGFGGKIRALVEPLAVLLSQATGRPVSLHHDPPRGAEAGMPAPGVDHPPQDRRQAGRHAAGARGRDDHRSRRLLRRAADDERRLPGQRLPVAGLRRAAASRC